MKTLEISHTKEEQVDILTLTGTLNADTVQLLDDAFRRLSRTDRPCLVLDASDLSYISSAGIGYFIGIIKHIRSRGGDIRFYNMQANVQRIFKLLDMDDFFKFYTDLDKAVADFAA